MRVIIKAFVLEGDERFGILTLPARLITGSCTEGLTSALTF